MAILPHCIQPDTKESIMKNTLLIFAAATGATMLVASSSFASHWDGHPDMESSILNDHDRPGYVGTSLSDTRKRIHIGSGPTPAFPNHDVDETGYVVGTAGPEKGHGDTYGSVLFDVGALRE
jgi:hypothetical protein